MIIKGYASHFNNKDSYDDIVLENAFEVTNSMSVPLMLNHNKNMKIGQILQMYQDSKGLFVIARLDNTSIANHAKLLLTNKHLHFMSIGYKAIESFVANDVRYLVKIELIEVSIVAIAANVKSQILQIMPE